MTTRYKILFMVELLHEYYQSLQSHDFALVPSAETIQLLKNRQILYKLVGNKLVVLTKVGIDVANLDQPFAGIEEDKKFVFYLSLNRPQFTTVTNLDVDRMRLKQRYYFSNIHENKAGDSLHLTKKIAGYDNAATYFPGAFADDGSGQVFECIRHTTGGNNTGNAAFWRLRGSEQYVSAADMLSFVTRSHHYQATVPAKKFSITVFGFNAATGLYDKQIKIANNTYTSNQPVAEVPVNLQELAPGRYRVQVNTDEFDVWVDDTAVYRNVFGVIEIFNHLPSASDFALLDAAGKVKDVVVAGVSQWLRYQVRFANRRAFWKYMTPRQGVSAITDKTGEYSFVQSPPLPGAADYFQSNHPIPIRETPAVYDLELTSPVSDEPPAAPNPNPEITGMLTRNDPGKDYYCTIYLNY